MVLQAHHRWIQVPCTPQLRLWLSSSLTSMTTNPSLKIAHPTVLKSKKALPMVVLSSRYMLLTRTRVSMDKSGTTLSSNLTKKEPNSMLMKKLEKCLPIKCLTARVKMANKFQSRSRLWIPVNLVLKACARLPLKSRIPMTTLRFLTVRYIFKRFFFHVLISRFFFQRYVENVKQDTNINTNILRVSASDEDADNNGAIRYSLTAPGDPSDLDYFDIQPESGWIYLTKPLDVSIFKTSKIKKNRARNQENM